MAIDPSSPLTGGAVLGDRIRMLGVASDPQVYVRSLAARGHLGGVSAAASRVIDVLDAAGKDLIIVETVGVGQSETEVSGLVHLTVLVCAPGMGDDVQMIKAGVLETADVYAVNKADLPDAQGIVRQLRASGHLGAGEAPPIVETIATTGHGAAALLDVLGRLREERVPTGEPERLRRLRRALESMAAQELARRLSRHDAAQSDDLARRVLTGRRGVRAAIDDLLRWGAPAAPGGPQPR